MEINERWKSTFGIIIFCIVISFGMFGCSSTTSPTVPSTTFSILGQVTTGGTGLSGVTITLSGGSSGTTTTNSSGNYSFKDLFSGSYTVTPSLLGHTFDPSHRDVTIFTSNIINLNFAATASISGQVTTGGTGLSGVTITLSGGSSGTTTTDNSHSFQNQL